MKGWEYRPARDLGMPHAERVSSLQRESGLVEHVLHRTAWGLIGLILRVRHRLRVVGREHLPAERPFLMVANHSSHLDALVLGSLLPAAFRGYTCPLAAGDSFFADPVRSTFSAFVLNALPLWRVHCGRHSLDALRVRLLEDQLCIIFFPEGTRTRTGEMGVFKHGVGVLVAGTGVPVIPCRIEGAYEAWPSHRRRPTSGAVTVTVGAPMCFADLPNTREGWAQVAASLEQAVRKLAAL